MLLDISRANLHSPLARVVFVTINGKVYKLLKAMYVLRDAGASFDRESVRCDELDGSVPGQFQHLCWVQEGRSGDDLLCERLEVAVWAIPTRFGKALAGQDDSFVVTQRGERRCAGTRFHLNRLLRLYPPGAERGVCLGARNRLRSVEILISLLPVTGVG